MQDILHSRVDSVVPGALMLVAPRALMVVVPGALMVSVAFAVREADWHR
jgi:hypothetical protein